MKYVSLGLRGLLTLAFVAAGLAKLAGAEMMVATFEAVGVGQWFRYVTGLIEVAAPILLWLPGKQVAGATMVGAVLAHLIILGPSAMPAIFLGLICAAVIYLHREQVSDPLSRAA
ncbi:DoxX family protein [Roseovarius aestuarii]|nr:DoxX family protein [Roseovarius aestuarii]